LFFLNKSDFNVKLFKPTFLLSWGTFFYSVESKKTMNQFFYRRENGEDGGGMMKKMSLRVRESSMK